MISGFESCYSVYLVSFSYTITRHKLRSETSTCMFGFYLCRPELRMLCVSSWHTNCIFLSGKSEQRNNRRGCSSNKRTQCVRYSLTWANLSKRAKRSLRTLTSSCAEHCDASAVNPQMSAKMMLLIRCWGMQFVESIQRTEHRILWSVIWKGNIRSL